MSEKSPFAQWASLAQKELRDTPLSALNRDYGVVLGTTILYMFIILALNLLVDLVYAWLDPKVRYR